MPIEAVNLIRLFDLYLVLMMLISMWRRRRVYIDAARIGWSNGSREPNTSYEVPGSGVDHAFVGSGPGHQHFEIRNPGVRVATAA